MLHIVLIAFACVYYHHKIQYTLKSTDVSSTIIVSKLLHYGNTVLTFKLRETCYSLYNISTIIDSVLCVVTPRSVENEIMLDNENRNCSVKHFVT